MSLFISLHEHFRKLIRRELIIDLKTRVKRFFMGLWHILDGLTFPNIHDFISYFVFFFAF